MLQPACSLFTGSVHAIPLLELPPYSSWPRQALEPTSFGELSWSPGSSHGQCPLSLATEFAPVSQLIPGGQVGTTSCSSVPARLATGSVRLHWKWKSRFLLWDCGKWFLSRGMRGAFWRPESEASGGPGAIRFTGTVSFLCLAWP